MIAGSSPALAASTIAVLGFFIIPNRRHEAKKDLHEKIETMREQLAGLHGVVVIIEDRSRHGQNALGDV